MHPLSASHPQTLRCPASLPAARDDHNADPAPDHTPRQHHPNHPAPWHHHPALRRFCSESGFVPANTVREAHLSHQHFYCDPTSNVCCPPSGIMPSPASCPSKAGCAAGDECSVRYDPCYEGWLATGKCDADKKCTMAPSYSLKGLYAAKLNAGEGKGRMLVGGYDRYGGCRGRVLARGQC